MSGDQGRPGMRRLRGTLKGLAGIGVAALVLTACETVNQGSMPVLSTIDEGEAKEPTYDQMLAVAQASERAGDLQNAASVYQAAAAKAPDDVRPLKGLGRVQVDTGAGDAAVATLTRALALAPQDLEVLRGLGAAEIARNRPDLAVPRYEAALAVDGRDVKSLNGLGVALDRLKRHDEAQARYAQALAIDPADVSAANNQALSLALAGRTGESLTQFRALMRVHGNDARVRRNYAVALGLAGRLEEYQQVAAQDLDAKSVQNNLRVFAALNGLPLPAAAPTELAGAAPAVSPRFAIIDEGDALGGMGTPSRPGPLPRIVAPGGVVLGGPPAGAAAPVAEAPRAPILEPPVRPQPAAPTVAEDDGLVIEPAPAGGAAARAGMDLPTISSGPPPTLSAGFGAGDAAMAGADTAPTALQPAPSLADILDLDDGRPSTISGGEAVSGRTLTSDMVARARAAQQAALAPPPAAAPLDPSPLAPPSLGDGQSTVGSSGGSWVQVGAYPSEDEAQRVLDRLRGRAPEVGSVPSRFEPITRNGMRLVRLRLGPFASAGAATEFCDALKAREAPCFVPGS
ncbi:SPOR domain-containing protein [Zavarzinia sp. CC-PAN008]|uniref:SPOR domain-containing protein n=1 Tax=Zavarzinia sp. CC-PAN008 TaxID=3243332 RepID=UPI003F743975